MLTRDKKEKNKNKDNLNQTAFTRKTYLKTLFDDEQVEYSAVQNETVLGIIGRYEYCWF